MENHIHIHHIMLYHFDKGWNEAQLFRDFNELFGEKTISKSQVERWHHFAFLQWTSFGISLGETPGETQTFFLLTFYKRRFDSSTVTRFFKNRVCSFHWSKSVKIRIRSALLLSESWWGTHPDNFNIFRNFLRRRTMVKCSANILDVKLSSSSTAAKSAWSSKFDSRPLPSSSARFVTPDLNFLNHLSTWVLMIVTSPKSSH